VILSRLLLMLGLATGVVKLFRMAYTGDCWMLGREQWLRRTRPVRQLCM
jgi:hypothetical protein